MVPIEHDLLDQLKNLFVKIPLLQAIKEITICAKTIKEYCFKCKKRKKDFTIIHVIGHWAILMSKSIETEKYMDPRIPIVSATIDNLLIPNTLIDLGT